MYITSHLTTFITYNHIVSHHIGKRHITSHYMHALHQYIHTHILFVTIRHIIFHCLIYIHTTHTHIFEFHHSASYHITLHYRHTSLTSHYKTYIHKQTLQCITADYIIVHYITHIHAYITCLHIGITYTRALQYITYMNYILYILTLIALPAYIRYVHDILTFHGCTSSLISSHTYIRYIHTHKHYIAYLHILPLHLTSLCSTVHQIHPCITYIRTTVSLLHIKQYTHTS